MVDLLNILQRSPIVRLAGPRIYIRPPRRRDQEPWVEIRRISRDFLVPWEPTWPEDATTGAAFRRRLDRQLAEWRDGTGYAFFIFDRGTDELLGGITWPICAAASRRAAASATGWESPMRGGDTCRRRCNSSCNSPSTRWG